MVRLVPWHGADFALGGLVRMAVQNGKGGGKGSSASGGKGGGKGSSASKPRFDSERSALERAAADAGLTFESRWTRPYGEETSSGDLARALDAERSRVERALREKVAAVAKFESSIQPAAWRQAVPGATYVCMPPTGPPYWGYVSRRLEECEEPESAHFDPAAVTVPVLSSVGNGNNAIAGACGCQWEAIPPLRVGTRHLTLSFRYSLI